MLFFVFFYFSSVTLRIQRLLVLSYVHTRKMALSEEWLIPIGNESEHTALVPYEMWPYLLATKWSLRQRTLCPISFCLPVTNS